MIYDIYDIQYNEIIRHTIYDIYAIRYDEMKK